MKKIIHCSVVNIVEILFLTTVIVFQSLKEAVKSTGRRAKQAFFHLEVRVLRPDKMKTQLEAVVKDQERGEGATGVQGSDHSQLKDKEDMREEYLSRLL